MNRNAWSLICAQISLTCFTSALMFVGGLIGTEIAPSETLATLPLSFFIIGLALGVAPATMLMARFGRKVVFLGAVIIQVTCAIGLEASMKYQLFYLLCLCCFFVGTSISIVSQLRFAMIESVSASYASKAVSFLLIASIVSAYIGPEAVMFSVAPASGSYAGSFVLIALIAGLGLVPLFLYRPSAQNSESISVNRRLNFDGATKERLLWVSVIAGLLGYAVMSCIMVVTPLSMHEHSHDTSATKWIMQSHMIMMFLPSLFTAKLLAMLGNFKVILLGFGLYLLAIMVALVDVSWGNYWVSLILLGIGWNFLFTTGTVLLSTVYTKRNQYSVQGLNDTLLFGGQAFAVLMSGFLLEAVSWNGLLYVAMAVVFFGALLIVILFSNTLFQRPKVLRS